MLQHGIRIGSIIILLVAGSVHAFPYLWARWERLLVEEPSAHLVIGITALIFGIMSVAVYIQEFIITKRKSNT